MNEGSWNEELKEGRKYIGKEMEGRILKEGGKEGRVLKKRRKERY